MNKIKTTLYELTTDEIRMLDLLHECGIENHIDLGKFLFPIADEIHTPKRELIATYSDDADMTFFIEHSYDTFDTPTETSLRGFVWGKESNRNSDSLRVLLNSISDPLTTHYL